MKKLNITQAAREKGCSRQAMHHLVNTGRVNTIVENRKRLVVIDEKFHAAILKQKLSLVTKEERIESLEKELALLKEAQRNMQGELEQIKSQIKLGKEETLKKRETKKEPVAKKKESVVALKEITNEKEKEKTEAKEVGNPITLGQLIEGFKVIPKTARGIKQYQAYKRHEGKQCYVYLCPEAKPITVKEAEEKIRQYCERYKV